VKKKLRYLNVVHNAGFLNNIQQVRSKSKI